MSSFDQTMYTGMQESSTHGSNPANRCCTVVLVQFFMDYFSFVKTQASGLTDEYEHKQEEDVQVIHQQT